MNNPQEGSIHVMNKRYDTLHILQVLQNTLNSGYPENIGIYYIKYLGVGRISSKAHKKVLGVRISAKQLRVAISGV